MTVKSPLMAFPCLEQIVLVEVVGLPLTTTLHCNRCLDLNLPIENVVIRVCSASSNALIICCVYITPNSPVSWLAAFNNLINHLSCLNFPVVIMGNFNIDLLENIQFDKEIFMNFGLRQYINEPTRITAISKTLLDHIYSNCQFISKSGSIELGIADHKATYCVISKQHIDASERSAQQRKCVDFRQVKKATHNIIKTVFNPIDWSAAFERDSINDAATRFMERFLRAWDIIALVHRRNIMKMTNPWMNEELLQLIYECLMAYKQLLKCRNQSTELYFKQLRRCVKQQIKLAKRQFFAEGAKNGGKFFWSKIKSSCGLGRRKQQLLSWPAVNHEQAL